MAFSFLGVALYATGFTFLVSRLRRYTTEDVFLYWPGNSTARQPSWLIGGTLFALVGMLTPHVLCGAINQAIGQVTYEHWRVLDKKHDAAHGECEFWVTLARPATSDSAQACMPRERWDQTPVDDSLTIMAVSSRLGYQVGPALDADPRGGGR
jgi:hypothetical protein